MNRLMRLSKSTGAKRAHLAAIAISSLVSLPGCGIPQLRCPQPGPTLPKTYNFANVWSNRPAFMGNGASDGNSGAASPYDNPIDANGKASNSESTAPGSDVADPGADDAANNSKKPAGPFSLISFVKPANALDLNQVENAAGATTNANAMDASMGNSPAILSGGTSGVGNGILGLDGGITSLEDSAQIVWCEFFSDPYLNSLISQALSGNQELKILAEDIQIAANEVLARKGAYFPFISLGAGAGLEKPSLFTPAGAVEDQLQVLPGKGFPEPLPDFLAAANLTWEIDIWRKLRNARDAASLRYLATAEGRNYIVTRMVAEVAENYYELLALDNRLMTLDQTIQIQEQSLETARAMMAAARGTELPVQRFEAEVRKNQSQKLIIQQQIVEAENRINFLLGRYPQPVERQVVDYIDLNLHALSAGVPAQLLRYRSDIRQAERELQAAGLDVKVARARFYPSLGISAGVGYRAFNPKYLLTSPESLIYNVAGDLVAPLFNRRAIKADYLTANAMQLQAVYNYQRTILNAFTEVINYMTKVENYRQSIEIKKQQLSALEGAVVTATQLLQNARGEYLDVLLSQRDMMEARMVLIETKQQQLAAVVKAYQALGGGGAVPSTN